MTWTPMESITRDWMRRFGNTKNLGWCHRTAWYDFEWTDPYSFGFCKGVWGG